MDAWLEYELDPPPTTTEPWVVYYPEDFEPQGNVRQRDLLDTFVEDLCDMTNAELKRTPFADLWRNTTDKEQNSLARYLEKVCCETHG